jgi:hypothetical protein
VREPGTGWLGTVALRCLRAVGRRLPYGTNVYDREWDVLVVLDACRANLLRSVAPEVEVVDDGMARTGSHSSISNPWILLWRGELAVDAVWDAYEANLRHVAETTGRGARTHTPSRRPPESLPVTPTGAHAGSAGDRARTVSPPVRLSSPAGASRPRGCTARADPDRCRRPARRGSRAGTS